ncbi:MAG: CcoQ/FixQ family Cbb3-type cytochrome c oxidase assembly chaperone [Bdellovibrionales bacterium]|nr:CcoQ/FixQ family Cbb3-type cytochrome c oxidase assembly chaperone [Bdellovibrionales bacterium]
MIRQYLAALHWTWLPVISMFLFLAVFLGVCIWVYRKESTEIYRSLSALPLQKEGDQR